MFKTGDKVSYKIATQPPAHGINPGKEYDIAWAKYKAKDKYIVYHGVVGNLSLFCLPVTLPDGKVRHSLYADLTFGTGNKVSFKAKKPDWKGVKKDAKGIYREVLIPGKPITVRGIIKPSVLGDLHIPVVVEGIKGVRHIPYKNLVFKETK